MKAEKIAKKLKNITFMLKTSLIMRVFEKSKKPRLCIEKIEAKIVYPIEIGIAAL